MTNKQAIKMLKSKMDGHTDTSYEWTETVRMAIRALEQQPCEDCVSRNAISQTLNTMYRYVADELTLCDTDEKFPKNEVFIVDEVYEQIVEQLPSVIPHPNTGKWIQESCEDCVSRQAVKSIMVRWKFNSMNAYLEADYEIDKLPSVTPQPCNDYISRQAVEEMIKAELPERGMWEIDGDKEKETVCEVCVELMQKLSDLQSVTPQPKTENLVQDCISRNSIKQKLQEHHDFYVNAYGGFSNLPQNDKSRVDEITNCIAMVVNEPPVTSQPTRWIPISERLPRKSDIVLLSLPPHIDPNGEECCASVICGHYIGGRTAEWGLSDRDTFGYGIVSIRKGISPIAWMPLPEPHREDFEDDN